MKRLILIPIMALVTGCQNGGDASICTMIMDLPTPLSPEEAVANNTQPDRITQQAEVCVHRQAYRLARSPDDAETVAKAVVASCESAVMRAVSNSRSTAFNWGTSAEVTVADRVRAGDEAEERANESWQGFALSKVVEGRAGNCKAD